MATKRRRRGRVKVDLKPKLKIDDPSFQKALLKNGKYLMAKKSALNGLRLQLQRELGGKWTTKIRLLKKRLVMDIATQQIEALWTEANTGRGAAAVKKRGGRVSRRGG